MSENALPPPLTVHRAFHASSATERALFGAFGSGKTYAGVDEAIMMMLEQPGIRGLAARQTIPELRDTLEPIFLQRLPGELRTASQITRTGGHYDSVIFPNGSTVLFRSLDDPQKHRSLNLGFFLADEANEIDPDTYGFMIGRLRQVDPTDEAQRRGYTAKIRRRAAWVMTNPSGEDWMWERFVGPRRKPGTEYFTSTSLDNPFLPPDYIETLLSFPEPWVRRYVLCSFDDFAGAVYPEWSHETHVIPPFEVPAGSVHWMGMDPGTRNPTAGLWVYVDQERRRLVGVDEYAVSRRDVATHAKAWRQVEALRRMRVTWRCSDPGSLPVADRGSNMSLRDQYRREGFNFALGPKLPRDRVPMLGLLIAQGRFVLMEGRCPETFRQVGRYRWEDISPAFKKAGKDAPEKPLKGDDDLVDCAQYVASRWVPSPKLTLSDRPETFSDIVWGRMRKQKARQAARLVPRSDPFQ